MVVGELTKAALKAAVAGLNITDPNNAAADFSYAQYLEWREKEDPMVNTLADLSAKAPALYDEVVALIASGAIKGNGTYPIAKRVSVLQAIVVAGRM